MFRRQVYAPTIPEGVAEECLRVVASHNRRVSRTSLPNRSPSSTYAQLLRDVGLDFTFLLSTLISPDPDSPHDIPAINPNFDIAAPTPAPEYHIEPSPYPSFAPHDDHEAEWPLDAPKTTAPLSINPRLTRRPKLSDSESMQSPESSAPRPEFMRTPSRGGQEITNHLDDEGDDGSLR